MNVIVYLNEARLHTFTGLEAERLLLRPGRNIVDAALFDVVKKKSESLQDAIEMGVVVPEGTRVDITKMDIKKAIQTLEMEVSIEGVKELADQEAARKPPRKQIMEAATAKIDALNNGETEALLARAQVKAKAKATAVEATENQGGAAN